MEKIVTYTYCVRQWLVGEGLLLDAQCGERVAGMLLVGTDLRRMDWGHKTDKLNGSVSHTVILCVVWVVILKF